MRFTLRENIKNSIKNPRQDDQMTAFLTEISGMIDLTCVFWYNNPESVHY